MSTNSKAKKKRSIEKKEDQIVSQQSSGRGLIDYPFPLRDGVTVRLMLPRDITVNEVKRLNAFMSTLAVDFNE